LDHRPREWRHVAAEHRKKAACERQRNAQGTLREHLTRRIVPRLSDGALKPDSLRDTEEIDHA